MVEKQGGKEEQMSLNIKNEDAHRMAQELAAITGETMSAAVTAAIRERLERARNNRKGSKYERIMAISRETAPLWKEPWKSIDHGDLLYDELGLPK
jgi:antitoxin VapB